MDVNGFLSVFGSPPSPDDGDLLDDAGYIICGKCGERKEIYLDSIGRKVRRKCSCEKELQEREAKDRLEAERKRLIELNIKRSFSGTTRYDVITFRDAKTDQFNQRPLSTCKRFADKFPSLRDKGQGLLLWGGVGTGKSYAAACIVREIVQMEKPDSTPDNPRFYRALMVSIADAMSYSSRDRTDEIDIHTRLSKDDLVVFDDLGTERNTGYGLEKLYGLIDERYRSSLPMIITTNLTLDEIKQEEDIRYSRIYDRILEVCFPIQFTGSSLRTSKRELRPFMDVT